MFGEAPSLLLVMILAGGMDHPGKDVGVTADRFQTIAESDPLARAVEENELRQSNLIKEGIVNGDLTNFEAKTLRHHQDSVLGLKEKFIRDGKLTTREIKILQRKLNLVNQDIWRFTINKKRASQTHYADGKISKNHRMNIRASLRY